MKGCSRKSALERRPRRPLAALLMFACGFSPLSSAGDTTTAGERPELIYHQNCSVCHGERGDGKSMARFVLDPPPADFTSREARSELSRAHMIETLRKGALTKEGKPTAMVAWNSQLNERQIEAVVDYLIVRFMDGMVAPDEVANHDDHRHHGHDHGAASIEAADYPYRLKADARRGMVLYGEHCASCHGERGDGRGEAAADLAAPPRDFRAPDFRAFATGFSLFSALSRADGHLPALEQSLSEQSIADVSEYVLTQFVNAEGGSATHR